jgi:hypothetical protein
VTGNKVHKIQGVIKMWCHLYLELNKVEDGWNEVIKKLWSDYQGNRDWLAALKVRKCEQWPRVSSGELWTLYAASRVNDVMLFDFQTGSFDDDYSVSPKLNITIEQYLEFFEYMGFKEHKVTKFHPFYCEIVEVIPCENLNEIQLQEVKWPALMLGNMLFSRAGVVVKSPSHLLKKGVADASKLYWTYRRKYRPTTDLSDGWGHNSQWSTDFRRDYDLGDLYVYNVDALDEDERERTLCDLRFPLIEVVDEFYDPLIQLDMMQRIDLLRHRCLIITSSNIVDDFWPYYDYFEERHC